MQDNNQENNVNDSSVNIIQNNNEMNSNTIPVTNTSNNLTSSTNNMVIDNNTSINTTNISNMPNNNVNIQNTGNNLNDKKNSNATYIIITVVLVIALIIILLITTKNNKKDENKEKKLSDNITSNESNVNKKETKKNYVKINDYEYDLSDKYEHEVIGGQDILTSRNDKVLVRIGVIKNVKYSKYVDNSEVLKKELTDNGMIIGLSGEKEYYYNKWYLIYGSFNDINTVMAFTSMKKNNTFGIVLMYEDLSLDELEEVLFEIDNIVYTSNYVGSNETDNSENNNDFDFNIIFTKFATKLKKRDFK